MIRTIQEMKNLKNKRVLVRVDFNVPIKNKKVLDDSRIKASALTINYLRKKGAKVILLTHLGRPEGKKIEDLTLAPIVKVLPKILKGSKEKAIKIPLLQDIFGEKEMQILKKMKSGEVVMFENIRFYPEEERNDDDFSRQLASLADYFVLDGFAVAHRDAASVSGVQKYLPSYTGFLITRELQMISAILKTPKRPCVAVIGGAKIETKLPVIKNLLKITDTILVGGAIVNVYFKARGYDVGQSLVDTGFEKLALANFKNKKVVTPIDVMVGDKTGDFIRVVNIQKKPHQICKKGEAILDIGPATAALYANYLKTAKTIVWNGAMGYFENRSYALGTYTIADTLAEQRQALRVVGGGETLEAVEKLKLTTKIGFVSTGGGAMLEYLSGKKLPGLSK